MQERQIKQALLALDGKRAIYSVYRNDYSRSVLQQKVDMSGVPRDKILEDEENLKKKNEAAFTAFVKEETKKTSLNSFLRDFLHDEKKPSEFAMETKLMSSVQLNIDALKEFLGGHLEKAELLLQRARQNLEDFQKSYINRLQERQPVSDPCEYQLYLDLSKTYQRNYVDWISSVAMETLEPKDRH